MPSRSSSFQRLPVRLAHAQLEAAVVAVMRDDPQAQAEADPGNHGRGHAGAGRAQGGQAQLAVDEYPIEQGLDADGGQVDRHYQLGARHRGAQRVDGAEHQRRGHRQHQGAQIGGDALAHVGRDIARHGQPDVGEQHQDRAHDGQAQRQPDALAPAAADLGVAAGAEVLGQDGNQRVHHAHQADEDGDVDRGRQRHRRQVGGAGVASHGGVQHAERDAGPLADQHGPGLPGDATQRGAKARGPW